MRRIRRHDLSPRVELLPMIDVIFLLLTFFIYSMVVLVQPQLLPVQFVPVGAGETGERGREVQALTLDAEGRLHLNREPIALEQLERRLREWADDAQPPRLFLAVERAEPAAETIRDRAPMLIELFDLIEAAGIEDFAVVGPRPGGGQGAGEGGAGGGPGGG